MKESLAAELKSTGIAFHTLLNSLSDQDLKRSSANAAWTNQQILFHMALGFFLLPSLILLALIFGRLPKTFSKQFARLLNAMQVPFNWINGLGPRFAGRVFNRTALASALDGVLHLSLKLLALIPEKDLQLGMYYPDTWDSLFQDYMRLEDIFQFPINHFRFHVGQISR